MDPKFGFKKKDTKTEIAGKNCEDCVRKGRIRNIKLRKNGIQVFLI
jgi:hypothetical protein